MSIDRIDTAAAIQDEIALAERRIESELQHIAGLAEFAELTLMVNISTKRRLNARETIDRVDVRIRAVL